ncbi:MAG: ferrous iron transport protein B [bacterium]|nr:ferrous iron transport protein B [bacterium]
MGISAEHQSAARQTTVAICGNPNCGKTTIFNALTGLRQKVGNYPGVTVEKTTGTFSVPDQPGQKYTLVDIPGSYSLAAFSPDEYIAVQALCGKLDGDTCPDLIVCVIDATNLERGLYLLFQVLQIGRPVMVALNMIDLAERRGIKIDAEGLSGKLGGVPVLPVVGSKGKGIDRLKRALVGFETPSTDFHLGLYDPITEQAVEEMQAVGNNGSRTRAEYLRILFDLEGPAEAAYLRETGEVGRRLLLQGRARITEKLGSLSAGETAGLTGRAAELYSELVTQQTSGKRGHTDKIDRLLLHTFFGPVILVFVMIVMFQSIFSWSMPLMDGIDAAFGALAEVAENSLTEGPLRSLLVDGVIGGVGSVLIFLPQIIFLFLFIALLEDSGYMPRAAFLVDRLLGWCGLSGRSFIPMLSSFACAIPGIMATRTIDNRNVRMLTILVAPLMSCSARLPVYTIMVAAFIPRQTYLGIFNSQGLILTALYLLGVMVAVIVSFVLHKTVFKSQRGSFMMEMPSYNRPNLRSVFIRVYNRAQSFLLRAGTVILAITIIIWALSYYPRSTDIADDFAAQAVAAQQQYESDAASLEALLEGFRDQPQALAIDQIGAQFSGLTGREEIATLAEDLAAAHPESQSQINLLLARRLLARDLEDNLSLLERQEAGAYLRDSYFGRFGRTVAPVFEPLGWDWKISMATLASFPAREVIIATLGTIYNLGGDEDETSTSLIAKMRQAKWEEGPKAGLPVFTPAVALSIMVFFALCAQCGATLVTVRQETARTSYAVATFCYMTVLAYVSAFVVYQVFSRMGT